MNATAGNIARFRLHWSGCSDRGKVRANNEDAFVGLRFNRQELERLGKEGQSTLQTADFVFAVSDGMGGAQAGEFASRIAVEKVPQILPKGFRSESGHPEADSAEVLLQALFQEIHKALVYLGRSYEECRGMETTLSLCWFAPGLLHFAHVGDSRIYHLPVTGGIRQLTEDDTHVGWLHRQGKINEREARTHPRRNVLQKALGGGNQFVDPQIGCVAYTVGDRFLLCSDGLVEGLYDAHLLDLIGVAGVAETQEGLGQRLVEASVAASGRDNTTALVIEVAGVGSGGDSDRI
jgi:protein phosphatase